MLYDKENIYGKENLFMTRNISFQHHLAVVSFQKSV